MHQDEGHYAGKHPEGTALNTRAAEAVKLRVNNGRISCRAAHEAAIEAEVSPPVLGQTLDLLEIRINGCQLGLFGHGGGHHGKAELKLPADADDIRTAVREAAETKGIACLRLWRITDEFGCTKPEAAAVCDEADVNINSCQLGAF